MVEKNNIIREENTAGSDTYNAHRRYCRVLGHDVPFSYCREPGNRLFCSRIFSCWGGIFDIRKFIQANYSEEEVRAALKPQQPKVSTLFSLIRQAQERM